MLPQWEISSYCVAYVTISALQLKGIRWSRISAEGYTKAWFYFSAVPKVIAQEMCPKSHACVTMATRANDLSQSENHWRQKLKH